MKPLRLLAIALPLAVACSKEPLGPPARITALPRALTAREQQLIQADNRFAIKLLKEAEPDCLTPRPRQAGAVSNREFDLVPQGSRRRAAVHRREPHLLRCTGGRARLHGGDGSPDDQRVGGPANARLDYTNCRRSDTAGCADVSDERDLLQGRMDTAIRQAAHSATAIPSPGWLDRERAHHDIWRRGSDPARINASGNGN